MKAWACIIWVALLSEAAHASEVACVHFWETEAGPVPSGKEVGIDVGRRDQDSGAAYLGTSSARGHYDCKVWISEQDMRSGRFLYIGEVGDASALHVVKAPMNHGKFPLPVFHGLSDDLSSTPTYTRPFPFWVPLRDIYVGEGEYDLRISYQDLVYPQTGIRSGAVSLEDLRGLIKRFFRDAPRMNIFLLEAFLLIFSAIACLFWLGTPWRQRWPIFMGAVAGAWVVFSGTSAPRFFMDPLLAIKLNDIGAIFAFPLVTNSLRSVTIGYRAMTWNLLLCAQLLACFVVGSCLLMSDSSSSHYLYLYFGSMTLTAGVVPLCLAVEAARGRLQDRGSIRYNHVLAVVLSFLGGVGVWDLSINTFVLKYRFEFFLYYAYFSVATGYVFTVSRMESSNDRRFSDGLSEFKQKSLEAIALEGGDNLPFTRALAILSHLVGSGRASIQEINGRRSRLLGASGDYDLAEEWKELGSGSPIAKSVSGLGTIVVQRAASHYHLGKRLSTKTKCGTASSLGPEEEYAILILRTTPGVCGALCLTGFKNRRLSGFLKARLERVVKDVDLIFSLAISQRWNRAFNAIMQANRLRIYPLQISCEKYFLENFQMSTALREPCFIVGDVVDSTPLKQSYAEDVIAAIIDEQLEFLFAKFNHFGIVISRFEGDAVSIMVPNQRGDESAKSAVQRGFVILSFLANPDAAFIKIARNHGVILPVGYKFVMSAAKIRSTSLGEGKSAEAEDSSGHALVLAFQQISSTHIDVATRILKNVAVADECLVVGWVADQLDQADGRLLPLPPHRLKGDKSGTTIFRVKQTAA